MNNIKYANAMAEVLHYLKGIEEKDINKIPRKLMEFIKENASTDYICNFDYTKPLIELDLLDETKGLIAMICYNYWCENDEEKEQFSYTLQKNEEIYQQDIKNKYNPDNIFTDNKIDNGEEECSINMSIVKYETSIVKKIIKKIKELLHIK